MGFIARAAIAFTKSARKKCQLQLCYGYTSGDGMFVDHRASLIILPIQWLVKDDHNGGRFIRPIESLDIRIPRRAQLLTKGEAAW